MKESIINIVFGRPVVLINSEQLKPLGHKELGRAYQDSLQINGVMIKSMGRDATFKSAKRKGTDEQKREKANKARIKYQSITRGEMDHRNETGRKGLKNRKVAK